MGLSAGEAQEPAEPLVALDSVTFSYGTVQVLFGVSFRVAPGEILGLLGTNGAGKSTILRVLSGLAAPDAGTVCFAGDDITHVPAEDRCRRGLALVVGGRAVFPDLSVKENLQLGGFTLGPAAGDRIERELTRFPQLGRRLEVEAGALSGGEQQQLGLAKALMLDPKLLCIDELSLGLAPAIVGTLFDVIKTLNAGGLTCLLVEQSLNIAAELCNRAVFLEKGGVKFEGDPAELLDRGDLARAVFLGGRM